MPIESVRLLLEWAAVAEEMSALCELARTKFVVYADWAAEDKATMRRLQDARWTVEDAMRDHARKLRETAAGMSEAAE